MQSGYVAGLILANLVLLIFGSQVSAANFSAEEARGREIYFNGSSSPGSSVPAYFGEDYLELSADLSSCSSCHGYDGRGRPESGLNPFNISWDNLTKSYGHVHPDGLSHVPFSEQSLKQFILYGTYPGGGSGDRAMPLYDYSDEELNDLIAFLKVLGKPLDPGLDNDSITLGTVLPFQENLKDVSDAIRQVLDASFADINRQGGLYGRTINLNVLPANQSENGIISGDADAAMNVFALLSTFTPGADREYQTLWAKQDIPLVVPLTFYPLNDFSATRRIFYLYPGLNKQILASLSLQRQTELKEKKIAIFYEDSQENRSVVESIKSDLSRDNQRVYSYPLKGDYLPSSKDVETLKQNKIEVMICIAGENSARELLRSVAKIGYSPEVHLSGVLSGSLIVDADPAFNERLYFVYPTLAKDRNPKSFNEFMAFLKRHRIQPSHLQVQISAYIAANLTIEGLRKSGRQLDRQKFISSLESLYKYKTGLSPDISYDKNRRIGVLGAYVIIFNSAKKQFPVDADRVEWVNLD